MNPFGGGGAMKSNPFQKSGPGESKLKSQSYNLKIKAKTFFRLEVNFHVTIFVTFLSYTKNHENLIVGASKKTS